MRDFPSKKEREEIDNLKEQMMKLQEESKSKDQRNKLAMMLRLFYINLWMKLKKRWN